MINFLNKHKEYKDGFTLIESIIAITVLTIVIAVPMTIISSALVSNQETKNSVAAQNLAQSILEEFRAKRDTNFINQFDWDTGFSNLQRDSQSKCTNTPFVCNIVFNRGNYSVRGSGIDYITISVQISWESQQKGEVDTTVDLSQTLYRWLGYRANEGTL